MAATEQKNEGKTGQDHPLNQGFDLTAAPRKRPMTPEEIERRIREGRVEESIPIEDAD